VIFFCGGGGFDVVDALPDETVEDDLAFLEAESACFHAGQIQDIVDESYKAIGFVVDDVEGVFLCLGIQDHVRQEGFGVGTDIGEGASKFVADVVDEVFLSAFAHFLLSDVADGEKDGSVIAFGVESLAVDPEGGCLGRLSVKGVVWGGECDFEEIVGSGLLEDVLKVSGGGGVVEELKDGASQNVVEGTSDESLASTVGQNDSADRIGQDNAIG